MCACSAWAESKLQQRKLMKLFPSGKWCPYVSLQEENHSRRGKNLWGECWPTYSLSVSAGPEKQQTSPWFYCQRFLYHILYLLCFRRQVSHKVDRSWGCALREVHHQVRRVVVRYPADRAGDQRQSAVSRWASWNFQLTIHFILLLISVTLLPFIAEFRLINVLRRLFWSKLVRTLFTISWKISQDGLVLRVCCEQLSATTTLNFSYMSVQFTDLDPCLCLANPAVSN